MKHEQSPAELTWYYRGPLLDAEAGHLKYDRVQYPVHGVSNNAVACYWRGLLAEGAGEMVLTDEGRARLDAWKASPEGQQWVADWDVGEKTGDPASATKTAAPPDVVPHQQLGLFTEVAR